MLPRENFAKEHLKIRILVQSTVDTIFILTFHKIDYPPRLRWKKRFVNLTVETHKSTKFYENIVILECCI